MSKYRIIEITKNDKVSYVCQHRALWFFWVDTTYKIDELDEAKKIIEDFELEDSKSYRKVVYYGKA